MRKYIVGLAKAAGVGNCKAELDSFTLNLSSNGPEARHSLTRQRRASVCKR